MNGRPIRSLSNTLLVCSILLIISSVWAWPAGRVAARTARPAGLNSYSNGPLVPPDAGLGAGSVDDSTATTTFTVLDHATVSDVTATIVFAKVGGAGCPGPGGGDDYAEEVRFRLRAPDGTTVTLVRHNDYWYSNPDVGQVSVTFDDDAPTSVVGLPIQSGAFKPSGGALADFDGIDPAANGGVWTLEIADNDADDPICFSSATLNITTVEADLSIEKTDTSDPVNAGQELLYTVRVSNAGPDTAAGVVVTDTLPVQVDYVDDTAGCALSSGTGPGGADQLVCSLDDIAPGANRSFQVQTRVPANAVATDPDGSIVVTNTAEAASSYHDPESANNVVAEGTFIKDLADLEVVKVSTPDTTVRAGEIFTYTIFADNEGPSAARNVVLTDTILSSGAFTLLGITLDPSRSDACATSPTAGGTVIGCSLSQPLEPEGVGGTGRWTLKIAVQADEAQEVNNVVNVLSADPDGPAGPGTSTPDPNLSNNQATDFIAVTAVADLEMVKTAAGQAQVDGQPGGTLALTPNEVTAGGQLTYTLTVINGGPSTAENVVLQDRLPGGITVAHTTPSQGMCSSGVPGNPSLPLTCNLGTLAGSHTATVTVVVDVPADRAGGTTLYNEAFASSSTFDPYNANDFDANETDVTAWADLAVNKVQQPVPTLPGDEITYTIAVHNLGPSDAPAAAVQDPVPTGLVAVTWQCTPSGDAACTASGVGEIDDTADIPVGETVTYVMQGILASSQAVTNTVSTTPTQAGDPYGEDNEDSAVNTVLSIFLPLVSSAGVTADGPDLVVQQITAGPSDVQVVVKNQGNAPVINGFYVDAYIDPSSPPSTVNQTWPDLCAEGLVWAVTPSALPLQPGQSIVLSVGGPYYSEVYSRIEWPLALGTPVYAQVDSYSPTTTYGAVLESHEIAGGAYNNIRGPVYTSATSGVAGVETQAVTKSRDDPDAGTRP
jgi:uncharacterized repeat protein (TIGR01451 family)